MSGELTHLGDGAYVRSDGYYLWVEAERADGMHRVALDPVALVALVRHVVRSNPAMGPELAKAAHTADPAIDGDGQ